MLTVVTGPACSGKSSYVREHAEPGDVVIDFDVLAQALGSPVAHDHPRPVVLVAVAAWHAALAPAVRAHRGGVRVWIVDTDPPKARRQAYYADGARFVRMAVPAGELERRRVARAAH